MPVHFAFSIVAMVAFAVGWVFGTWDRRNVVKALRVDSQLARAQRREYEREVLSLRCQLGTNTERDDARAGVLARESGMQLDEEPLL